MCNKMTICPKSFVSSFICVSLFLVLALTLIQILSNFRSFVVLTGSMSPAIPQGSMTYVKSELEYKKGDIITFSKPNGSRVTHRIAQVEGQGYITRGDANSLSDSEVIVINQVIGKTFLTIPHIGNVILFLKSPNVIVGLAVITGMLVSFKILRITRARIYRSFDMFVKTELHK